MTLKTFVNKLFIAVPGVEHPIEMKAAENYDEDYDDNYAGPFLYNGTVPLEVFALSENVLSAATLLCYGVAGGEADYKLNEILSIPIGPGILSQSMQASTAPKHMSPVLINSPPEVRYALIEFPTDLMELFGIPKYIHMAPLDLNLLKKTRKYNDVDLKARGIDPDLKNWVCNVDLTIPDWCYDSKKELDEKMLVELQNIVARCRPVSVHCYSYTGVQRHEIHKNVKNSKPKKR